MIVREAPVAHWPWLAERAQLTLTPAFRAVEAVDLAGRIHAMVGFDGWTPNACSLHVAVDYPAALRHVLTPTFRIVFDQLGLGLVNAIVLSTNEKSLALVKHLGFKRTHAIRDGWQPGVDLVFHEMRRENCRWVEQKEAA